MSKVINLAHGAVLLVMSHVHRASAVHRVSTICWPHGSSRKALCFAAVDAAQRKAPAAARARYCSGLLWSCRQASSMAHSTVTASSGSAGQCRRSRRSRMVTGEIGGMPPMAGGLARLAMLKAESQNPVRLSSSGASYSSPRNSQSSRYSACASSRLWSSRWNCCCQRRNAAAAFPGWRDPPGGSWRGHWPH